MLITIDTSTDVAGLAIASAEDVFAEFNWRCGQNHSVQLLPNLSFLLRQAGFTLSAAEGIIVARGPGGYNGLRVGIATAKSLAFSLGIPVAGVSTLEAMAFEYSALGYPVCAVVNPGGGEIAAAMFETKDGLWLRTLPEQAITVDDLCANVKVRTVFCGQIPSAVSAALAKTLGEKAVVLPGAEWRRTGAFIELGRRRFRDKDFDNPSSLQPLYLRGPAITQPKHK